MDKPPLYEDREGAETFPFKINAIFSENREICPTCGTFLYVPDFSHAGTFEVSRGDISSPNMRFFLSQIRMDLLAQTSMNCLIWRTPCRNLLTMARAGRAS